MVSGITQRNSLETGIAFFLCQTYLFFRRKLGIINESGLYSLILSSKLESAKRFKRWVTSEVLPCIRKHGGYLENYFYLVLLHHLQYSYDIKNH